MKSNVTQKRLETGVNDFEGLNGTIEVLVIDSVFIVPHPGIWSCDLGSNEENAVISWIRFAFVYSRAGPGRDGRLLSHGRAKGAKIEIRRPATHALLLVGDIVIHVALIRVSLAPGVLVLHHVLCFGKIGGARILGWDQVVGFNQNSVRRYVMIVAGVVIRCKTGREISGEWIDPGTRTDAELVAV